MEGQELRDAKKLWADVAVNESRMHMMVELTRIKVGLADIEEFSLGLDRKDKIIRKQDVNEIEKQLNGHCAFWCKMWRSGDAHGHKATIIDSKVCRSCKVASMYVMVKAHKKDGSTCPVVTGCSSNARGLSNAVSDFLESVANSIPDAGW